MSKETNTEGTEASIPPIVETTPPAAEAEKPKRTRKPKDDEAPPVEPPPVEPPQLKQFSASGPAPWPTAINGKLGPKEPAVQAWLAENGYEPHATLP